MAARALLVAPVLMWTMAATAAAQSVTASSPLAAAAAGTAASPSAPPAVPPARTLAAPPAETAYRAKVQALVAPLLATAPSIEIVRALKEALKARTPAAAVALDDPTSQKLAQWHAFRGGGGDAQTLVRFAADNPAWPDGRVILRRAEEQLFGAGGSSADIRAFFKGREPVSGAGWAALASAYLAEGDEAKAKLHAARAWADEELTPAFETGFLDRFGKLLGPDDHRRRLDRVLVDRLRFAAERRERATIARRIIPHLPEAERKAAEARLAVLLKDKGAPKLLAALPGEAPSGAQGWGLAFARAVSHLDGGRLEDAAKILTALPDDAEKLVSPDDWWLVRREAAYRALTAGSKSLAYDLVKAAGPLSVNPLKEQAHMAGWIALRLLKKPDAALRHFEVAVKSADGPLSRARSAYWSARTLEVLGRKDEADKLYRLAMRDPDTFHALLARQKVAGGPRTELTITPPALPTAEEAKRFLALDAVRAAVLSVKAGLDRNITIALFAGLRNHLRTEGEMALLAELAASLGDPQTSLRVGKAAIARGLNLMLYAYPIDPFPVYDPIRPPPETALLLAVTRQETEFNTRIVSTAGARG
ncbi:MAG: lytic transglycosylase domain-containing protein, partial [Hyphomicrobiaceae bacterium]